MFQRDSWMEAPLDLIPTITRKEIRDAQKAENQEDEKKVMVDQVSVCVCEYEEARLHRYIYT